MSDVRSGQKTEMLRIVQTYDAYVEYVEPITHTMPRRYSRMRDAYLDVMWRVPEQLYVAAMSDQVSHVHKADAMLATLRWFMRRMTHPKRKMLTPHQQQVAEAKLAEVGGMIHAWLERKGATRKPRARQRA